MDIRPELAVAYGGGGLFGIGYGLGVAHALIDADVPLADVPAVGTSAGSWVASAVVCDIPYSAFEQLNVPRLPNFRPRFLLNIAQEIFGDAHSDKVKGGAATLTTLHHRMLSGAVSPLASIVAASSSVPGLFAPSIVGGLPHVDGGVRSIAAVHRASPADRLLVVAPVAGPLQRPVGRFAELQVRREARKWVQQTGNGVVHLVRPNSEVAALVRHPVDMFDQGRALEAYWLARQQVDALIKGNVGDAALRSLPTIN